MITIEMWAAEPNGTPYCFSRSEHADDAYDFDHVLACCPRSKRVAEGSVITETVPTYYGRDLDTKEALYAWMRFVFPITPPPY